MAFSLTKVTLGKTTKKSDHDRLVDNDTILGVWLPKTVIIGDWDMNTDSEIDVNHGLTLASIRQILVMIRNDADTLHRSLIGNIGGVLTDYKGGGFEASATYITLYRVTGGDFDSPSYETTSYNRGWIYILYEP